MGLDIRTISFFVGALSAVQALGLFVFSKMVGSQPGVKQYAWGNAGFALSFLLLLLRGVVPDFLSIVVANTAISLSSYIIFWGVCAYTNRASDRRPFLLIPGLIFLFFLYFTYVDNDITIRTILISGSSAFFSFLCSYILFTFNERQLKLSSRFTATVLLFYGLFLVVRSILAAMQPLPEEIFINTDLQILSFLLMALCGLLWSIGFALMMAQRLLMEVHRVSMTDYLTGILNRRAGQEYLERLIKRGDKDTEPFSILMIDIDHFKTVNDVYGHSAGDIVLQNIAGELKARLRPQDTLCRWGGEEFLLVLPGAGQEHALGIAERIRRTIAETKVPFKDWQIRCTISLGVAGTWEGSLEADELLVRADRSLYAAKHGGRNQVVPFVQSSHVAG